MSRPVLHRGNRKFSLNDSAGDTYGIDPATTWPSSLYWWWRASDLPLSQSQRVLSWQGFTGNATTSQSNFILLGTAAQAPTYATNSFGTLPGVYFNGFNNYLNMNSRYNITPTGNGFSMVWIGRPIYGGDPYYNISSDPAGYGYQFNYYSSSPSSSLIHSYDSSTTSFWGPVNLPSTNVTKMITFVKIDLNYMSVWDGITPLAINTSGINKGMTVQYWGSYGTGTTNRFLGYWAEVLVITAILTQSDIVNLHDNYFKIKYASDPLFS